MRWVTARLVSAIAVVEIYCFVCAINIARILRCVRVRDDSWVTLAACVFGQPERDLRDKIADGGDNVCSPSDPRHSLIPSLWWPFLASFGNAFQIYSNIVRNTLPRLQHDFCTLWNEVVQEARNRGPRSTGTRRSPTVTPTGISARVTVVAESTGRQNGMHM